MNHLMGKKSIFSAKKIVKGYVEDGCSGCTGSCKSSCRGTCKMACAEGCKKGIGRL